MTIIKWDNNYYLGKWIDETVKHYRAFQTANDKLYLDTRKTTVVNDYMIVRAILCKEIMLGHLQEVKEYINEVW